MHPRYDSILELCRTFPNASQQCAMQLRGDERRSRKKKTFEIVPKINYFLIHQMGAQKNRLMFDSKNCISALSLY